MMIPSVDYEYWMGVALQLAEQAGSAGEIPVGAVIVHQKTGELIAVGENLKERTQDPTAHAEIVAIRRASHQLHNWYLHECILFVTLEPCPMCAGAILQARIATLVYGTDDPKTGAIQSVIDIPNSPASFHKLEVIRGICQQECQAQLQKWFAELRQRKKQAKYPTC
ncbi:MAG: tRNA adenosine(34) deaminase TadA [Pseudanabaenaceae cyanobacterium]